MPDNSPQLVCLTPVKNEAPTLGRFLDAASTWADLIVVADQMSIDGSREIVEAHPKAVLVLNESEEYNEAARQRLLVEEGRRLTSGSRIFIALDADEALTANATEQPEWAEMLAAAPGTVLWMQWVNILPDEPRAWIPPVPKAFGFVDDGSPHQGARIHTPRLPTPPGAPALRMDAVKVLHLQHLDSERMDSKQRWYQMWERLEEPDRRLIQIYRRYHHMDAIDLKDRHPLPEPWLAAYKSRGIDLLEISPAAAHYWDEQVMDLIEKHGVEPFRRLDLWSVDWQSRADALGRPLPEGLRSNPRSQAEKAVFAWLARTQHRAAEPRTRWVQRALRLFGW
jgi:hypothetical protein